MYIYTTQRTIHLYTHTEIHLAKRTQPNYSVWETCKTIISLAHKFDPYFYTPQQTLVLLVKSRTLTNTAASFHCFPATSFFMYSVSVSAVNQSIGQSVSRHFILVQLLFYLTITIIITITLVYRDNYTHQFNCDYRKCDVVPPVSYKRCW